MPNNNDWSIRDSLNEYQVERWSNNYFTINELGHMCARADIENPQNLIDLELVIQEARKENIKFPMVIRFHDILRSQVRYLNQTFQTTIREAQYKGHYCGVYPIKVNQLREVVEEVLDAGEEFNYGLEAGSKPEILAALAYNENCEALTILNGYKDKEFMQLALIGRQMQRKTIIVIEKLSEIQALFEVYESGDYGNNHPLIGVRAKLAAKGSGKWADSTGDQAKFGLSIPDILELVEYLKNKGKLDWLVLFHFHVGSQIPDIRTIKESITEGVRIFCHLQQAGCSIQYFDVGGGVGINYDGTQSNNASSTNYKLKDYIADVVYILRDTCNEMQVEHPNIVTESGRAVSAFHSCVVTDVFGEIKTSKKSLVNFDINPEHHVLVHKMKELLSDLNISNYQDIFNDTCLVKEEALGGFKLGIISLEERSLIERMSSHITELIIEMTANEKYVPNEIKRLSQKHASKYLCNFSVFQSCPDSWAIEQILPVTPIKRLNERPTQQATLADITCDSDGKITQFLSPDGHRPTIKLHKLKPEESYPIALFLTGAYQDVMGDMHNLFGRLNEVHVYADESDPQGFYIEEYIPGNQCAQVLNIMQYNPEQMSTKVKKVLDKVARSRSVTPKSAVRLHDLYEKALYSFTYLNN